MLHLRRGIAFRVDVGDLLELESALERDGKVHPAAEIQRVARVGVPRGELPHLGLDLEGAGHEVGQAPQLGYESLPMVDVELLTPAAEVESEQQQRDDLRRER